MGRATLEYSPGATHETVGWTRLVNGFGEMKGERIWGACEQALPHKSMPANIGERIWGFHR